MKRTLTATLMALFLCVFTVFGLTACGDKCEHTYFSDCDETCDKCQEEREITVEHNYYGECDNKKQEPKKSSQSVSEDSIFTVFSSFCFGFAEF